MKSDKILLLILSGLVILSAGISILALWLEPVISRDGILYLEFVKQWCERDLGIEILIRWIPVFPLLLIKWLHCCGIPLESAAAGLNILLRSMLPLIGFGIVIELCGQKKLAVASALLLAVHPSLTKLAIEPQRDMVYLFFSGLLILFFMLAFRRQKWYYAAAAGIAAAAALLSRTETLEIIPLTGLLMVIILIKERLHWKIHFQNMMFFAASVVIGLLLLFTIVNLQYKGGAYHEGFLPNILQRL